MEACAAACEDKSCRDLAVKPGALQIVANQGEQFHCTRLDDVRQHVRKDRARRAVAHAGNLDRTVFLHECGCGAAIAALDSFGFGDRGAQTDGQIIREVIAANRNGAGVPYHASAENNQFRGAAADVQQAAAEIALVLREARFRGSERLQDRIADEDAGLVRGGDEILRGGNSGSHQMNVYLQPLANHANSIAYAVLGIHHEFMWKDVQDLAVFRKGDIAGRIDGAAHVFALDVSRTLAQGDAAAAVYSTHVASGHSDQGLFHRNIRDAFGLFDRATDGTHRGIKIDDQALAQALGFGRAERQKLHQFAFDLGDQDAGLRAADVQTNKVFIFLRHAAAPAM